MEFFRKAFSGILGVPRVSLDQSQTAFFAANEVWEANQVALAVTNWTAFQEKPHWNSTARKRTKKERKRRAAERGNLNQSGHQYIILRGTPASFFIQQNATALAEASLACSKPESPSELIIWADGSVGRFEGASFAGYASVFKRAGSWVRLVSRRVAPRQDPHSTELRAIELGLDFALQMTTSVKTGAGKLRVVKLFTDSLHSVQRLLELQVFFLRGKMPRQARRGNPEIFELLQTVAQRTKSLERAGAQVELHWVPRNKVEGNIVADKAAGVARFAASLTSSDQVQLDWDLAAEGQIRQAETAGGPRRRLLVSNKAMAETVGLYLSQGCDEPVYYGPIYEPSHQESGQSHEPFQTQQQELQAQDTPQMRESQMQGNQSQDNQSQDNQMQQSEDNRIHENQAPRIQLQDIQMQ